MLNFIKTREFKLAMTRNTKAALMFLPLILAFAVLIVLVHDLQHPVRVTDKCALVGRGASVQAFKHHAVLLYQRSGKQQDDIGLTCHTLGAVLINDDVPLPLVPHQTILMTARHYHWLPTRYNLSVRVINPKEAALNQTLPKAISHP